jgi:dTDP-glucose 4,6-dehydratase
VKLLVTGGAGFIGSNFILNHLYHNPKDKIINLDKLTYAGNLNNLREMEKNKNYKFIKGDICDKKIVSKAMNNVDAIINFAAESHVDNSLKNPDSFMQTNIFGTFTLLEEAKKQKINKFVHISCYDEKTKALTTDGLKNYNELKKGDKVFSLNPKTKEIEIKPIEKVIIQKYKGKMIHFKNKRIDLKVTPNHKMFILNTKKNLIVEEAEKAKKRSIFFMPEGKWQGKEKEFYSVKGYKKVKTKDLMYLLGIFIGDGFTAYQEKEIETKSGLNKKDYLKKAKDTKTGKFMKLEKQGAHKTISKGYRIFFDIPKKDKCRKKVEKTLKNLEIKYSAHEGKAGTHLYFTSKAWLELFNQCSKGAHNKHIPNWALDYSSKYLKYLFDGLMDSDGHKDKIYYSVSKRLIYNLVELCMKLNLKTSVNERYTKTFFEGRKIEGKSYYISVAKTKKSISKTKSKTVNYNGKIWCLKVKDNKNFLVERNGKFDFCGNTDEVYGSIPKGSFTEESVLNPRNPYSASKAGADRLAYSYTQTFDLNVSIVRPSNNFGPMQYPEKLLPFFVTNLLTGKKVPIYGNGKQIRDWLFVYDNCNGIEKVLEKGKQGEAYNIAGEQEKTNLWTTKFILNYLGADESKIKYVKDRQGHDKRYSMKANKIKKLGFKLNGKLEDKLAFTIDWYEMNYWWWKPLIKRKKVRK